MRSIIISIIFLTVVLLESRGATNDSLRKYYIDHILYRLKVERVNIYYYWSIHVVCPDNKVRKAVLDFETIESLTDSTNSIKDILLRDTINVNDEFFAKIKKWEAFVNEDIYAQIKNSQVENVVKQYIVNDELNIIDAKKEWLTALVYFFDRNLFACSILDLSGASVVDLTNFDERFIFKNVIRDKRIYKQKWSFYGELLEENELNIDKYRRK